MGDKRIDYNSSDTSGGTFDTFFLSHLEFFNALMWSMLPFLT